MKLFSKKILLSVFLLVSLHASADRFSYVYIQGDKQIPFYVKLEDDMLPRYSKNYTIIPQLAAGAINIQILFQQNEYPVQRFTIQVPQDGYRGFLLTKKDNAFALFDIQQHFYLLPGEEGEDHLPQGNNTDAIVSITESIQANPSIGNTSQQKEVRLKNISEETPQNNTNEPQFINDIELNNERKPIENVPEKEIYEEVIVKEQPQQEEVVVNNTVEETPVQQEVQQPHETINIANEKSVEETGMHNTEMEMNQPVPQLADNKAPIINSDCPQPLADNEFDEIFITSRGRTSDDKRIGYLMKKAGENCFTTRQAFLLSRQLQAESMRYSFLKKIYPRITDQQNFPLLGDALFKTLEWKSYFKLIYE